MVRHLEFYTDGAYSSRTEMGGWAAICLEDGIIIDEQKGFEPYTTNNRMELNAFLSALENIDTIQNHASITINTDSAYIANCFNDKGYLKWLKNGGKTSDKQEVKNQDLGKRIVALYIKNSARFEIKIIKVKSHSDNKWNNYVDLLACRQREKLEK